MFAQIKRLVNHNKQLTLTAVVSAVMFALYIILPIATPATYLSPDETANAYFATTFAEEGRLWYIEPLNLDAYDRLHPRSMESIGGLVHPSGFWGMSMLYGLIGSTAGVSMMHLLTALLAIIASIVFRKTITKLFDQKIAWMSWGILLVHPAWWYYASRGWHHNILFTSLLILGAYVLVVKPFTHNVSHSPRIGMTMDTIFACVMTGLAVFVRPVALVWLLPTLALVWYMAGKRTQVMIQSVAITAAVVVGVVLMVNTQVFGSLADVQSVSAIQGESHSIVTQLFPDGYNLKTVARSIFYYYGVKLWWLVIPLLITLWTPLSQKNLSIQSLFNKKQESFGERREVSPFAFGKRGAPKKETSVQNINYVIIYGVVTGILLLWYGSWRIADNPDISNITLANSYMRYWLPSYVLSAPLIAMGLRTIIKKVKHTHASLIIAVLFVGLSSYAVFSGRDGMINQIAQLKTNETISQDVSALIPEKSIIITNRHDKLFFPDHKVLFPIDHPGTFETIRALKDSQQMYVYGLRFSDEQQETYNGVLRQIGTKMEPIHEFGDEQLYKVVSIK